MNDFYEKHKNDSPSVASVVYFKDGVTKERVEKWLNKLMEQGYVVGHDTREYQDAFGSPTWYIP
jgi:hypothetical protein